jgi:CRP/FNR family transcriptional regulator, cyclic AMP receptor protein
VITNGEVRISKFIPNIGEEALAVRKPRDYFGEMTLIDTFPRSTLANADVALLAITKTDLDKILIMGQEPGHKLL